jgi:hypothetical protein
MAAQPQGSCQKFKLELKLTPQQLAELQPIIQNGGKVAITSGEINGSDLTIAYVSCNAPLFTIQGQSGSGTTQKTP